jgi:hypothetical protein
VSQSYLTAIYPIVIFCYILIQNPLQLPLIQTGKNGIVYEQERLNYEIVDALTRWATRHLELKRQMIENEKNKKKDEKNEKDEKKNDPKNKKETNSGKTRNINSKISSKAQILLGIADDKKDDDDYHLIQGIYCKKLSKEEIDDINFEIGYLISDELYVIKFKN